MEITPELNAYIGRSVMGALVWGGFVGLLIGFMIGFTACYILLVAP